MKKIKLMGKLVGGFGAVSMRWQQLSASAKTLSQRTSGQAAAREGLSSGVLVFESPENK